MVGKSACRLDLLNFAFKEEAAALALTFVEMEIACKSWRNACSNLCAASLLCSNGLGGCCGWSAWMNALASPSELETDSAPAWSPAKFGVASATPLPLSEPLALRHWVLEGRGIGYRKRLQSDLESSQRSTATRRLPGGPSQPTTRSKVTRDLGQSDKISEGLLRMV